MQNILKVFLNGQYLAPDQASISVFDRGFIFGDGVYEVIPAFGGRLFRLSHHLSRLDASLAAIRLQNPHSAKEWEEIFTRLLAEHGDVNQYVYLQVTRGVAPRDHAFPTHVTPTVFAYAQKLTPPPPEQVAEGVAAITAPDIRWHRCDIKAIALLANALLRQQAIEQGAVEAILIRDGVITEGAASNIFVVKNNRLATPPKGPYILPGITRDLVVEIARAHGIACDELPVKTDMLAAADEVWLTSSTKEILPITRIDGKPVGNGKPGSLFTRLYGLYQEYKEAVIADKAR